MSCSQCCSSCGVIFRIVVTIDLIDLTFDFVRSLCELLYVGGHLLIALIHNVIADSFIEADQCRRVILFCSRTLA